MSDVLQELLAKPITFLSGHQVRNVMNLTVHQKYSKTANDEIYYQDTSGQPIFFHENIGLVRGIIPLLSALEKIITKGGGGWKPTHSCQPSHDFIFVHLQKLGVFRHLRIRCVWFKTSSYGFYMYFSNITSKLYEIHSNCLIFQQMFEENRLI